MVSHENFLGIRVQVVERKNVNIYCWIIKTILIRDDLPPIIPHWYLKDFFLSLYFNTNENCLYLILLFLLISIVYKLR